MAKSYDASTRFLIERHPHDWLRLLGIPATEVETLDMAALDTDLSTVTAQADGVFRVKAPVETLLHLELETGHHGNKTPDALLRYSVLLTGKYALPVQSSVVLLRPEADSPELTGILRRRHANRRLYLAFRYNVIRVWELSAEELLTGGIGTLPLVPIAKLEPEQLPTIVRRMEERFESEASAEASELWTATRVLMGLRYSRATTNNLLKGVRRMRDSVTYMEILEEGIAEGITQGVAKGEVSGEQKMLLAVAERRLGTASPEARARIAAIQSSDRLLELANHLLTVETWEEFLAVLPQR